MNTLHEDQYTFLIIPCSITLTIKNVGNKYVEKIKTHTYFIYCSLTKTCTFY